MGFCEVDGVTETTNAGFSGTEYFNPENALGAGIVWHVNVPSSGTYAVEIRYANGGNNIRPGDLLINNIRRASFSFEPTGAWDMWQLALGTVNLPGGSNRIDLVSMSAAGLANIDSLRIDGNLIAGNCSIIQSEGERIWTDPDAGCNACHNSVNARTVDQFRSAFRRVGVMNRYNSFTDAQIRAIIDYLNR